MLCIILPMLAFSVEAGVNWPVVLQSLEHTTAAGDPVILANPETVTSFLLQLS